MQSKSFCEDLTEGKFSFPIIHAIQHDINDTQLISILRQRTEDYEVKKHAVRYMHQCGSLIYTREVLRSIVNDIFVEIDSLGGHERLKCIIMYLDSQLDTENDTKNIGKIVNTDMNEKIFTL
jgi:geranylgeranyl diphosphate synthase type 3